MSVNAASSQELEGYMEVLALDLGHTEYGADQLPSYEATAGRLALVRRPLVGVLAIRGRNELWVKDLVVTMSRGEVIAPLARALGSGGMPARLQRLSVTFAKDASVSGFSAAEALYSDGVLQLGRVQVQGAESVLTYQKARYDERSRTLWLDDGRVLSVAIPGP